MERLTRARDAVVEAVLAGAAVGLVEGVRVGLAGHGAVGAPAIAAAATLVLALVAIAVRAGIALLVRVPLIAGWLADLRAGGAQRVGAASAGVVLATMAALFAFVAFRVFGWAHVTYRFHDADAIGALVIAGYCVLALALVLVAVTLVRVVRVRLPAAALDGGRATIGIGLALGVFVLAPSLAIARAVPAFDVAPVVLGTLLVAVIVALQLLQIRTRRVARWGAVAAIVAAGAGTWALGSLPAARLAIVEHGVPSKLTAKLVWKLADADRDGFPGASVGGADCDDDDPARNPGALDHGGNGIDENCTGSDASREAVEAGAPAVAGAPHPNMIVISVDALRADRLGAYGYTRKTPALDKLAATGVRFAAAFTSCPSTRCAIPSLLTGRFRPAPDAPTLASLLRDAGYETASITCCERFSTTRQESAGFRTVDASADATRMQRAGQSNADVVVDRILDWLGRRTTGTPYLLWTHLYEPHAPYEAPAGPDLGSSDSDRYDREVAYVDQQIARLVEADPTAIVVITADHGEELNEHGIRFHARSLYNQVIRVPLILRVPGAVPRVIETPVSIVDIVPTLLDLAGAARPQGLSGLSFARVLRGDLPPARPILVELAHDHQIKRDMAAVIQPPWKAIWDREANAWSMYKLDDLADEHDRTDDPALAAMQRLLLETLDRETAAR